MVSAWAAGQQMVLGQLATDENSNEITAVPELLDMLDIAGCIITADAMSCQKAITGKIVGKDAEYVLSLKDNQPTLYAEVKEYFEAALQQPTNYPDVIHMKTSDKGDGRIKTRTYYFTTNVD